MSSSDGQSIVEQVVNATLDAAAGAANNSSVVKLKSTPEGMAVAYGSLILMAVLPIFYGSYKSVSFHKEQKESGEQVETMTRRDAAMFPVYASGALFVLYLFFKFFSKDNINLLLSIYFLVLGTVSLASVVGDFIDKLIDRYIPSIRRWFSKFHLHFTQDNEDVINLPFDTKDIAAFVLCGAIGIWYVLKKHWLANNLFGFSFAIKAIEFINLNNIGNGCILLSGLFFYDIFWVFGTDVMVTVAKSFDAPIKLIFPQDFLENGIYGTQYAMLGLGDIVIPGVYIALLLRFDVSLNRPGKHLYFYVGFIAYIVGLLITMGVLIYFKHAQPALLYLVPCCLLLPFSVALIKGDFTSMMRYEENTPEENSDVKSEKEVENKKKE